jgi:hypothetical protein
VVPGLVHASKHACDVDRKARSQMAEGTLPGYNVSRWTISRLADMSIDPNKWSEALKAAINTAGIYKLALAAVCGFYWFASSKQIIPSAENWEIRVAALGFILFLLLWVANVVASVISFFQPRQLLSKWIVMHRKKRELINYIKYMTNDEREIIAYLLAKNIKTFKADADGGKATTLLSRGIVITLALPNQCLDFQNVPMTIPDPFWDVLQLHKDQFPYTPPTGDKGAITESW